jgi:hypothetical protein
VIIHAEFREPGLAGILEPPEVGARRDTIFVVSIDLHHGTARIGDRHYAPTLIGDQPAAVRRASALVPHQWRVIAGTIDIAARQSAACVALLDNMVAVEHERCTVDPVEPTQCIIRKLVSAQGIGLRQAVLDGIRIGRRT